MRQGHRTNKTDASSSHLSVKTTTEGMNHFELWVSLSMQIKSREIARILWTYLFVERNKIVVLGFLRGCSFINVSVIIAKDSFLLT